MRTFLNLEPSFIKANSSDIKNITYYNTDISKELYENICGNCKIDDTTRGFHCALSDISTSVENEVDILFITESWDEPVTFGSCPEEQRSNTDETYMKRITKAFNHGMTHIQDTYAPEDWVEYKPNINAAFNTTVKCPSVRALSDIGGVKSFNACSQYIQAEIEAIKPKNIILLGPLAVKGVLKKGSPTFQMGKVFDAVFGTHECKVGCLPSVEKLLISNTQLQTNIQSILTSFFIASKDYTKALKNDYACDTILIDDEETYDVAADLLKNITSPFVAIDIETTGLSFLDEEIRSISLAFKNNDRFVTLAITVEAMLHPTIEPILKSVLSSSRKVKVFHNSQFDIKFLKRDGFEVKPPISDTKILAHLSNENDPKSLMFLTKKYFPGLV